MGSSGETVLRLICVLGVQPSTSANLTPRILVLAPVSRIEPQAPVFADEVARSIPRAVDHEARNGRILKRGRDADLDPLRPGVLETGHESTPWRGSVKTSCTPHRRTPPQSSS